MALDSLKTDFTPHANPSYFGAHLNMARHNVFLIANHLRERLKQDEKYRLKNDEEIVWNDKERCNLLLHVFDPTRTEFDLYRQGAYSILKRYLPIIRIFNPEDAPRPKRPRKKGDASAKELPETNQTEAGSDAPTDFDALHRFLLGMFNGIEALRNAYTHAYAVDSATGGEVTRRHVLPLGLQVEYEAAFRQAVAYTQYNFESTQEGVPDTHAKDDFEHLRKSPRYNIFDVDGQTLTPNGFYFFICCFLEKQYGTLFLKRIAGFKNETSSAFRATLRTFTAFGVRLPQVRLQSEDARYALLLDMLNELNRCPKDVYLHLLPENRREFARELDDEALTNVVANNQTLEGLEDDIVRGLARELSSLHRAEDRFPYFALRYLDEEKALDRIRFHIRLGELRLRQYPKPVVGIERQRNIVDKAYGFARLSNVPDEDTMIAAWRQKPEDTFFEHYAPHYHMPVNKIGLRLLAEGADAKTAVLPTLSAERRLSSPAPHAFLSVHSLPRMMVLQLLRPGEPERLIIDFLEKSAQSLHLPRLSELRENLGLQPQTRFVENHRSKTHGKNAWRRKQRESELAGRRLKLAEKSGGELPLPMQLPRRVRDFLLDIQPAEQAQREEAVIREMWQDTRQRSRDAAKGRFPKIGEMATFLARDMADMVVDVKLKQRMTTIYYRLLQRHLAYFHTDRPGAVALCQELGLFVEQGKGGHVFMKRHMLEGQKSGVRELYNDYLKEKLAWMAGSLSHTVKVERKDRSGRVTNAERTVLAVQPNVVVPYSLKRALKPHRDFAAWLADKHTKPVDLPADLFDAALCAALREQLGKKNIPWKEDDTFARLLGRYVQGDTQPFYGYTRRYEVLDKPGAFRKPATRREVHIDPTAAQTSKHLKTEYGRALMDNERAIRFHRSKDRVTLLMCQTMLAEFPGLHFAEGLRLSLMHPDSPHSPLDAPVVFRQSIQVDGRGAWHITAADTAERKRAVQSWTNNTAEYRTAHAAERPGYRWTARDFGAFRRFVADRRLPALLPYFESREVPIARLEWEIAGYDRCRHAVFSEVFRLEEAVVKADKQGLLQIAKGGKPREYPQIPFWCYLDWLQVKGLIDATGREFLRNLRNKFSHSEFPPLKSHEGVDLIGEDDARAFAERFGEQQDGKIEAVAQLLPLAEQYLAFLAAIVDRLVENIRRVGKGGA